MKVSMHEKNFKVGQSVSFAVSTYYGDIRVSITRESEDEWVTDVLNVEEGEFVPVYTGPHYEIAAQAFGTYVELFEQISASLSNMPNSLLGWVRFAAEFAWANPDLMPRNPDVYEEDVQDAAESEEAEAGDGLTNLRAAVQMLYEDYIMGTRIVDHMHAAEREDWQKAIEAHLNNRVLDSD